MAKRAQIEEVTLEQIASICDHTFLKRSEQYVATKPGESPVRLREKAFYEFLQDTLTSEVLPYAVCVRPEDVAKAHSFLATAPRDIKVASVVGFPDGSAYSTDLKLYETHYALDAGASEIDMVLNIDAFRTAPRDALSEITTIGKVTHDYGGILKLILETAELGPQEIKRAAKMAGKADVDFIKTSTGFGAYGARVEDLHIMRANFARGIKISGGVNPDNVHALLKAANGDNSSISLDPMRIRIGESSLLRKLQQH